MSLSRDVIDETAIDDNDSLLEIDYRRALLEDDIKDLDENSQRVFAVLEAAAFYAELENYIGKNKKILEDGGSRMRGVLKNYLGIAD